MKKMLPGFVAFLMLSAADAGAREGYHIRLRMPDVRDSVVYLAHYYGQARPHIYVTDSARFDKSGVAVFDSKNPDFVGGIYILLVKDTARTNFEILLNKGDELSVTARRSELPDDIRITGSAENTRFLEYQEFLKGYAAEQKELEATLSKAKTQADTAAVRAKARVSARKRLDYIHNYEKTYPNTLLAEIFGAMESPEIPEGSHYLEDGVTKDSTFAYRYYKQHYWDGFNFGDDRLIYTPVYDAKIEEYISKLVVPASDSVEKECDMLLKKAKGTKDMFHYTLFWLTRYAETSKIMGMDEVFVYLVENYYMKGDAFWLTADELKKYTDRAMAIAPNVIGNLAPEIKLPEINTKKEESLHALKGRYTLILFYSPTCGHCQHEIPLLDSVYEGVLKNKGVKVYTVATEGDEKTITDFLKKHNLDQKWTNTWGPHDETRDSKIKYDVFSTPTIYLLDDKKIIRGKRLDHTNIAGLIEMLEKRKLTKL